jgi:hypothetical protein
MRRHEWALAYREPSGWRRNYGSGGVPVPLVAASPEMRKVCGLLDDVLGGEARYALIQGPQGSGKSSVISAAQAACADAKVPYLQVFSNDYGSFMSRLAAEPTDAVILIDDCARLPPVTFRKLVETRGRCRSGILMTTAKVTSEISTLFIGEQDLYIKIPSIQDRPDDLLLIGSLMWERLAGTENDLATSCDDIAVDAFLNGIYPNGAWSLEKTLNQVYELVGDGAPAPTRISYYDLTAIFMRQARDAFPTPSVEPTKAVLVVEGETDVTYLRHAATLAERKNSWQLLDGLDVQPAGTGREGGGGAAVERVAELRREGISALGLFDYDKPGREAFDAAGRQKQERLLFPWHFDPLHRDAAEARVEIEDLLPVEMMAQFYATHESLSPEEKHWRRGDWRIVPLGVDKDTLATWVCEVADFEDMERFIYVLVQVRQKLKLPCPAGTLAKSELARLAHRSPSDWLNANLP